MTVETIVTQIEQPKFTKIVIILKSSETIHTKLTIVTECCQKGRGCIIAFSEIFELKFSKYKGYILLLFL